MSRRRCFDRIKLLEARTDAALIEPAAHLLLVQRSP
jgi:hypothetical protein